MRLRRFLAIAVVAPSVVMSLSLTPVAEAMEGCDRTCTIDAANQYLAALVSHDGSDVPLHPDAWRQENGGGVLRGGENIREALSSPIMYVITGIHDLRWYVEGDDAMAVYFLDTVAPTYIFERFRVDDAGLITQIDAHFYIDAPGHVVGPESVVQNPQRLDDALFASQHGPLGPIPVKAADAGNTAGGQLTGDDVVALVDSLLDAMVHGGGLGFLSDDVSWTINHRRVADPEAQLASAAASIAAIPDPADESDPMVRYVQVDGNQATVLYHVVTEAGSTLYAATRIATEGGQITEIESVCDSAELCM